MSQKDNIRFHLQVIAQARRLPVGSTKRITLISRSIQGIVRAYLPSYNPNSFTG